MMLPTRNVVCLVRTAAMGVPTALWAVNKDEAR